jgi:hypothetical protein
VEICGKRGKARGACSGCTGGYEDPAWGAWEEEFEEEEAEEVRCGNSAESDVSTAEVFWGRVISNQKEGEQRTDSSEQETGPVSEYHQKSTSVMIPVCEIRQEVELECM